LVPIPYGNIIKNRPFLLKVETAATMSYPLYAADAVKDAGVVPTGVAA
jgi:hypothetical protein